MDPHLKEKPLAPPTLSVVRLYSTLGVLLKKKGNTTESRERTVTKKIDFSKGTKKNRIPSEITGKEIKGLVIIGRK